MSGDNFGVYTVVICVSYWHVMDIVLFLKMSL
jgi:hypothetical protein